MKRAVLALAMSAVAMAWAPATAFAQASQSQAPTTAPIAGRIDATLDRAIAENRIVGAVVVVVQDGKVVYRRAAGLADREAKRPMRADGVFRLASVSKPYVTAAAMRLVEEGRLKLDDPVSRWLPYFRPKLADGSSPVITIGQLLRHQSGLSYGLAQPQGGAYSKLGVLDGLELGTITLDQNMERLAGAPLESAPGTRWAYSLGIDVIGAVIQKVTGQPLPEAVDALVLRPLGLNDTGFLARDPARLVTPYATDPAGPVRMTDGFRLASGDGKGVVFAPGRALDPKAFPSGGAGMVGTADDLARFLETIRTGGRPILKPATVATMMRDQVGAKAETQGPGWGFGYGWAVLDDPAAAKTPQSAGTIQWGGAYGHYWFVDPAAKLTVVSFTNTTFEGMAGPYIAELRDAVYGRGK